MLNMEEAKKLLNTIEILAKEGKTQKEIATHLGYKTTFTLNNHLIKASQLTKKSIPPFKNGRKNSPAQIHYVEIRRRGKGEAFGVNIPQEPLIRSDFKVGDKLKISVRKGVISLSLDSKK